MIIPGSNGGKSIIWRGEKNPRKVRMCDKKIIFRLSHKDHTLGQNCLRVWSRDRGSSKYQWIKLDDTLMSPLALCWRCKSWAIAFWNEAKDSQISRFTQNHPKEGIFVTWGCCTPRNSDAENMRAKAGLEGCLDLGRISSCTISASFILASFDSKAYLTLLTAHGI